MRVYLGVLRLDGRAVDETAVADVARRGLPFRTDGRPDASWRSADGRVHLHAWHTEPHQLDGATGWSGYMVQPAGPARSGDVAGVWARLAADEHGLTAETCASGAEVVYHARTADAVVVGNRALLVHLVADAAGPTADLVGLAGVVATGYPVTDRTAFVGVRALAPASRLRADAHEVAVHPLASTDLGTATTADVAERLIASVRPLAGLAEPVRLGLTGGRDSRLVLALLHAAGVPVQARTTGAADDPDVVVATQVAAALGTPHHVHPPSGMRHGAIDVDPLERLHAAVRLGEGMLGAYDRVGKVDDVYRPALVPFSGSGGEILRGYFASSMADLDDAVEAERELRARLLVGVRRLNPDLGAAYQEDVAPWLESARQHAGAALEDFYVRQRIARWQGAARSATSTGSLGWRPFLDHHVVATARRVPLPTRTSERLVADVLDRLAPELAGIRFAGQRWAFDRTAPTDPAARAAWEQREPVGGRHGGRAGLDWRTDLNQVREVLREVVLDAPPELWELVDRRRVEGFLGRAGTPSRKDAVQTWHLATVAWALASRFGTEGRAATASRPVHVEPGRPESTAVVRHRPGEVLAAAWRRATRRSSRRQPSGGEVRRIGALAVQERPQRLV
ncbi:MAG TPA: asparagine synthase-related protein, partial [Actinotalea caeni]|uniref:asparagine synthase-related protein n=1 Tax=Actinotalea caeni TaxID=1348467 RepID=UPI002B4B951A